MRRKPFTLSVLMIILCATTLWAVGEARIEIRITDANGDPLPGVDVLVKAAEQIPFEKTYTSDEKGLVKVFVINGTVPYEFTYTKEGFAPFKQRLKLKLMPELNSEEIVMRGAATAAAPQGESKEPGASSIYNEGVELFRNGQEEEAIAKFQQAVEADPSLSAGWTALAKLYAKHEHWDQAIEAGLQSLDLAGDDQDIFRILANAYGEIGQHQKAKEYENRLPKNAASLFNEAVPLLNAGNDADAEPLLLAALKVDPDFSKAHFELGNLYARKGNNTEAKKHLTRYVELEPEGENAEFAKEMMKYLQ